MLFIISITFSFSISFSLALALGLVPLSDLKIVHKHVESLNVPNYLKQHKHSVESSKTE